jgi:hypothetical protein
MQRGREQYASIADFLKFSIRSMKFKEKRLREYLMTKILAMITLMLSLSIMAVSCRVGATYENCLSSCDNKAQLVYLTCTDTFAMCSLLSDFYEDSCDKACE